MIQSCLSESRHRVPGIILTSLLALGALAMGCKKDPDQALVVFDVRVDSEVAALSAIEFSVVSRQDLPGKHVNGDAAHRMFRFGYYMPGVNGDVTILGQAKDAQGCVIGEGMLAVRGVKAGQTVTADMAMEITRGGGQCTDGGADASPDTGHGGASGTGGNGGGPGGSGGGGGAANAVGIGLPCGSGSECVSTFCVEGVCCESACNGACEACGEMDTKGLCVPVTGTPRPTRQACAGAGTACAGTCDGASRLVCTYPGSAQSCRAASCTTATATLPASCDGKGACPPPQMVDCAPNVCAGTICSGGCSDALPCTGSNYCSAGRCVPKKAVGQMCQTSVECAGGACADGYCCNTACTAVCMACNLAGLLGTCSTVKNADDTDSCSGASSCDAAGACKKKTGQTCSLGTDCVTGNCPENVCCNVACAGQCESCAEAATKGTCTPVAGAPRTGKTACAGAGTTCGGMCDGTNRTACAYKGSTVSCRPANCASGMATSEAFCNGAGTCPASTTTQCGAYACNGTTACFMGTCSSPVQCATNSICSGGCVRCPAGQSVCSNTCVDATSNDKACGATTCTSCGGSTPSCVNSVCTCQKKDSGNMLTNPGLDGSASPWVLGGAAWSPTDFANCVASGSLLITSLSQIPSQCVRATPGTYHFGFVFKGMFDTDIGQCGVTFHSDPGCMEPFLQVFTAATPSGSGWVTGTGDVDAPSGTQSANVYCASPAGLGNYDRLYFRTSFGGF